MQMVLWVILFIIFSCVKSIYVSVINVSGKARVRFPPGADFISDRKVRS
jgi:hypothetical protein